MGSVTGAGVAEISNQMEYDDEVAYEAVRKIYDLARGHDERPWCQLLVLPILTTPTLLGENIGIFTKIVISFYLQLVQCLTDFTTRTPSEFLMQMIGEVMTSPKTT